MKEEIYDELLKLSSRRNVSVSPLIIDYYRFEGFTRRDDEILTLIKHNLDFPEE